MTPRTTTGLVLEKTVIPALDAAGYRYRRKVRIGKRPNGRRHICDILVRHPSQGYIIVSVKWQQVSGTAEQKIPFEVICLQKVMRISRKMRCAYIVLGGTGWTLREFYTRGGLRRYLPYKNIHIVTLDEFIAIVNRRDL